MSASTKEVKAFLDKTGVFSIPCLSVKYTFLIKSSEFDQFTISPSSKIIWPDSVIADRYSDSS